MFQNVTGMHHIAFLEANNVMRQCLRFASAAISHLSAIIVIIVATNLPNLSPGSHFCFNIPVRGFAACAHVANLAGLASEMLIFVQSFQN